MTVSALGVYDHHGDGLDFAIPVGLYDSACTLLASVTVPEGTGAPLRDGYRYVGITPLVLASGQTFRIAAVMHCDDDTPGFNSLATVSLDPALTAVLTRRIGFGSSLACPTETTTLLEFAPNFLIGPACGNGIVQAGEQCDDGNTADGDCCSSTCQYEQEGAPCPPDEEICTDDLCNATGSCMHPAGNTGAVCRAAAGECDLAETCNGSSPACPDDAFQPDHTPCTDDGLFCTGDETCSQGVCTSSGNPCIEAMCDESADQCVTPTPSTTATATPTATRTATLTATETATASPTGTVTRSPTRTTTVTPVDTGTATATAIPTASVTPTFVTSPTATRAPTDTATVSATPSITRTATHTGTLVPTSTPPGTATHTSAATAIPTATTTTTATPTPSRSVTRTQAGSPTATIAPTGTATPLSSPTPTATAPPTPTHTPVSNPCVGDCDRGGTVVINELIIGVTIALGSQPLDRCPAFDASGNGVVEINELIIAVNNALSGCPRGISQRQ